MSKRFVVSGTKYNDVLKGSNHLDILFGKKGNDVLVGRGGTDLLFGGKGDDKLFGGDGRDFLFGDKGNDKLFGGDGDDFLFGDKGNDKLFGGKGNDKLFGGKDNDYLDGGAGSDYLFGDKGNDTFNFNWTENLGAKDHYDGGKGLDTLKLTLTTGELKLAQQEIGEFKALLANGGNAFHFDNFGLTVRKFEAVVVNEVNTDPTAEGASFETDEDTSFVIDVLGIGGLASDPDRLDELTVSAVAESEFGAAIVVNPDGSIGYDPSGSAELQALGKNDPPRIDSFSYTVTDLKGATSTATINVTVTGLDDEPTGPKDIKVAIVSDDGVVATAVAGQLTDAADNPLYKFVIDASSFFTSSTADWSSAFDGFDVVVIGEDGFGVVELNNSQLFGALDEFIVAGGGVVTTGLFASYALPGAEAISPIVNPAANGLAVVPSASRIDLNPLDPAGEFIAGDDDAFYFAQGLHEYAADGKDGTAQVLAEDASTGRVYIAYDQADGAGRTVYLGSLHMAGQGFGNDTRVENSAVDLLFERAVAWAGGVGPDYTVDVL